MIAVAVLILGLLIACLRLPIEKPAILFEKAPAIYYVSPEGSDSNPGSLSAPFRTIQRGADVARPGDTVIVRDGLYTDTDLDGTLVYLKRGGAPGALITFKSENKWGAVLDGLENSSKYAWLFGAGARYVRIEGFEIRGFLRSGFWFNARPTAYFAQVCRNLVHHIGRIYSESGEAGGTASFVGYDNGHIIFEGNVFHHIGRVHHDPRLPTDEKYDHPLYLRGTHITVMNNLFYENRSGWNVLISDRADYIKVINNTLCGANPSKGGQVFIKHGDKRSVLIENNISYEAGPRGFVYFYNSSGGGVAIRNNLVYGTPALFHNKKTVPSFRESGNMIGIDPGFVEAEEHNYRLGTGSPAIDAGLPVPDRKYDAEGNPVSGPQDIGAYEFQKKPGL